VEDGDGRQVIPKNAFFFWDGPEMSWLRKESVASFTRLNPSWDVSFVQSDVTVAHGGLLGSVLTSDWMRYRQLHRTGGFYFDTDIVFTRPIPDEWLEADLVLPEMKNGRLVEIAALGSSKGQEFFRRADLFCEEKILAGANLGYWDLGSSLLSRCVHFAGNCLVLMLPIAMFYPVESWCVPVLWNKLGRQDYILDECVGVHWFAGDPTSRHYETLIDEQWVSSDTFLSAAIRKSRSYAQSLKMPMGGK
jgi:hypothetical protein